MKESNKRKANLQPREQAPATAGMAVCDLAHKRRSSLICDQLGPSERTGFSGVRSRLEGSNYFLVWKFRLDFNIVRWCKQHPENQGNQGNILREGWRDDSPRQSEQMKKRRYPFYRSRKQRRDYQGPEIIIATAKHRNKKRRRPHRTLVKKMLRPRPIKSIAIGKTGIKPD